MQWAPGVKPSTPLSLLSLLSPVSPVSPVSAAGWPTGLLLEARSIRA